MGCEKICTKDDFMNRIVSIGDLSRRVCYLNMSKDEALSIHMSNESDEFDSDGNLLSIYDVEELEFEKSFCSHRVWGYE